MEFRRQFLLLFVVLFSSTLIPETRAENPDPEDTSCENWDLCESVEETLSPSVLEVYVSINQPFPSRMGLAVSVATHSWGRVLVGLAGAYSKGDLPPVIAGVGYDFLYPGKRFSPLLGVHVSYGPEMKNTYTPVYLTSAHAPGLQSSMKDEMDAHAYALLGVKWKIFDSVEELLGPVFAEGGANIILTPRSSGKSQAGKYEISPYVMLGIGF